jgi:hypothetical protein
MIYPNFFIVGSPKCGTTSLSAYLRVHPNIFMSIPKEPSYFANDFPGIQFVQNRNDYLRLFSKTGDQHLAIGEASPAYIFSRNAIENIRAFNRQSKIIIMLRKPVDMLLSYHAQLVYSLFENVMDFEKAWHLQKERARGLWIPRTCREPKFLQYRHVASFGRHMQRILDLFSRDQIHVVFFEEFIRDTKDSYRGILNFLGVPDDERTQFPVVNERKSFVSSKINRALHLPPKLLYRILNLFNGTPIGHGLLKCHEAIKQANSKPLEKISTSQHLRLQINSELQTDIELLSRLLDKNLSHWVDDID